MNRNFQVEIADHNGAADIGILYTDSMESARRIATRLLAPLGWTITSIELVSREDAEGWPMLAEIL